MKSSSNGAFRIDVRKKLKLCLQNKFVISYQYKIRKKNHLANIKVPADAEPKL
jgi:hypothetical protein